MTKFYYSQVIKYFQMKGAFGPQFASPHFLNIHDSLSPSSPTPPTPMPPPPQQHNSNKVQTSAPNPPGPSGNALAVSPIPGRDRIPSPQEIAIHTQQIMQNALIKRKLEEQKENFRRRQEHDLNRKSADSPSASIAFTPTCVMKKMAADRRDSDPKPVIPELKVNANDPGQKMSLRNSNSPGSPRGPPQPPMGNAGPPMFGAPAGPGGPLGANPQQPLLFMQQQIRAQQLAALQVLYDLGYRTPSRIVRPSSARIV